MKLLASPVLLAALLFSLPLCAQDREAALTRQLFRATVDGDVPALKAALAAGANPNAKLRGERTGLHVGLSAGRVEVVEVLLEAGAKGIDDPLPAAPGEPLLRPLLLAAWTGDAPMVKALLRHGADPSVLDGEGKDAMAGAIAKGSAEALRALLEAGAQPNRRWADGHCAVTRAALHGQVELLKLVLDHKGDPDFRDDQGITPLMFAVAMGHEAAARLLLERGAKVHPLNAWQHSALEEAKAVKDEALRVRLVALLRQHGAKEGNPMRPIDEAFLKAAHEGDLTQLKALLDKGADVHARGKLTADLWIRDALSGSVKHMAVCRFLLERKINVRMKDGYEFTALHAAAREGSPAMVKLLVEQGLDPNAKSKSGFVPLFMAINGGHRPDNAAMLLQLGADPNGRAITGDSLLAYARKRNHTKMAQLLEAAGGKE